MQDKEFSGRMCQVALATLFSAFVCTLVYNFVCNKIDENVFVDKSNYFVFAIVIVSFFAIFLLLFYILSKPISYIYLNDAYLKYLIMVITIAGGIATLYAFVKEKSFPDGGAAIFIWHKWYIMPLFFILSGISCVCVYIVGMYYRDPLNRISIFKKKIYKWAIFITSAIVVLVYATFYNYVNSDIYHCDALYTSVFNIMNNQGYSDITNSIYGCYAILLRLPMMVLGGEAYYNFAIIMAICVMIEYLCAIYIINKIVDNLSIRVVVYIAALWPYVIRVTAGYQVNVIRVFFPMILLAYLCNIIHKQNEEMTFMQGFIVEILIVFSIIWNKESGVICMIAYAMYTVLCSRGVEKSEK